MNQRLGIYRRLASARSADDVAAQLEELRDRYGPPPPSIENLAEHARIRLAADRLGLESVDRQGSAVVLKFRQDAKLDPAWLMRLVQSRGDLTLLPPAILRLDLSRPSAAPRNAPARPAVIPPGRLRPKAGAAPAGPATSWWIARATAGEVTSGFNRETLTADDTPFDPAARDGLFERLKWVLTQLNQGLIAS